MLKRTLHPRTEVQDRRKGIVQYVASDETIDSYREVIRADGWRFTNFRKNAPFVDSHNYDSLDHLVGRVLDCEVRGRRLIETVQWAIDVTENQLAQLGFRMTEQGYLKAVSVGFFPVKMLSQADCSKAEWKRQLSDLQIHGDEAVSRIYLEQEQIELSSCIIGANPNALAACAKAHRDGLFTSREWSWLAERMHGAAERLAPMSRDEFLRRFDRACQRR